MTYVKASVRRPSGNPGKDVYKRQGNNSLEYEFNEDYTAVVHRHVDPDVKKWILSRCKHRV